MLGGSGDQEKGIVQIRFVVFVCFVPYYTVWLYSRGGANTISNFECDGGRGEGGISWWQSKAGIFVGGNMRDRRERQIAIGHWRFENICGGRKLHVLLVV